MQPDVCHREPEFSHLQERIRAGLLKVYNLGKNYVSILLTGSGTVAVESMVTSLVPRGGKLLILANGVYGERILRIAECHGIAHVILAHGWGEELDAARVEELLQKDGEISHVAVVHHETTTGRLNDLQMVGTFSQRYGTDLLVDATSSFGAEDMRFDEWGITACAASANKCLHSVAGAAFVVAQRPKLEKCLTEPARSVYMNLGAYYKSQEEGSSPFTHAVQVFYALDEALAEFMESGGWTVRRDRYQKLASLVRQGAQRLGLYPYLSHGALASALTAFHLPENVSYQQLHDQLRDKGFVIYAGQGGLSDAIFRIATMGDLSEADIERFLVELEEVVCKP